MKTLKEIHESQGGKFGYKVRSTGDTGVVFKVVACGSNDDAFYKVDKDGEVFKVIGYDSEDDTFWLRPEGSGKAYVLHSDVLGYTLIEEPIEIWLNIYKEPSTAPYFAVHPSHTEASKAASGPNLLRTAKFREVIET